jgi:hypothetical protein
MIELGSIGKFFMDEVFTGDGSNGDSKDGGVFASLLALSERLKSESSESCRVVCNT